MIVVSTVITVTNVTTNAGLSTTLGAIVIVTLIIFLCIKELSAGFSGSKTKLLERALNVSIVPLIVATLMFVAWKIMTIIG